MEGDPKAVKILKLFILGIFMIVNSYGQIFLQEKDRIFLYSFSTDKNTQQAKADPSKRNKLDEIVYVLRMPKTWTRENETLSRKSKIPSVRGVICICTWMKTAADLKDKIATYESSSFKHIIQFADENNLALVTWSNFGGYEISSSVDEMNKTQVQRYNAIFENRLLEWERGYKRVLFKYNLPKDSALIYGFSGGGQIAHRIALRRPQYFSGIHIHVNSSYDVPTSNAKNMVWLVTTGELEYGYKAATRFYKNMIDMGYSVIFKAGENLGHATNAQINALSLEFFKYVITFIPDPTNPNWKTPPVDKFYLMRHPIYVGDYLNNVAYPIENAVKHVSARKYMVALPTKSIATAWGNIIE